MCRPQVQAPSGQAHGQPQLVHVWVDPEYAAKRQNAQHTYLGVSEDKRVASEKKWHASINRIIKGEQRRFDRFFATEEEAAVAINTWCEQHGMTAPNFIGGRPVPASQLPAPPQTAAAGPRSATPAQRPPRRRYIPRRRAPSPGSPAAATHYGSPALAAKSRTAPTSSGSEQTPSRPCTPGSRRDSLPTSRQQAKLSRMIQPPRSRSSSIPAQAQHSLPVQLPSMPTMSQRPGTALSASSPPTCLSPRWGTTSQATVSPAHRCMWSLTGRPSLPMSQRALVPLAHQKAAAVEQGQVS